jgi:hypothetical protein
LALLARGLPVENPVRFGTFVEMENREFDELSQLLASARVGDRLRCMDRAAAALAGLRASLRRWAAASSGAR